MSPEELQAIRDRHREVVINVQGGTWDEVVGEGQGECTYCHDDCGKPIEWPCDAIKLLYKLLELREDQLNYKNAFDRLRYGEVDL